MVDCKKCTEWLRFPCAPLHIGTCEVCGNSVMDPCDEYFVNEHGVTCHAECKDVANTKSTSGG